MDVSRMIRPTVSLFVFQSICIFVSGCALCPTNPVEQNALPLSPHGVVRTGGHYLMLKSLEIPASGLSLGEVVTQHRRNSAVAYQGIPTGIAAAKQSAAQENNSLLDLSLTDRLKQNANEYFVDDSEEIQRALLNTLAKMRMPIDESKKLIDEFKKNVDGKNLNESQRIEVLSSFVKSVQDKGIQLYQNNTLRTQTPQAPTQSWISTTPDLLVSLTRANGRQIVIPEPLVSQWIAGDIALINGDRVEMFPLSAMDITNRLKGSEESLEQITSSSLGTEMNLETIAGNKTLFDFFEEKKSGNEGVQLYSNVAIVTAPNEQGTIAEYVLPRPEFPVFAQSARPYEDLLRSINLKTGDSVHLTALELTPLIVGSRSRLRSLQSKVIERSRSTVDQTCNTNASSCTRRIATSKPANQLKSTGKQIERFAKQTWNAIPKPDLSALNPL